MSDAAICYQSLAAAYFDRVNYQSTVFSWHIIPENTKRLRKIIQIDRNESNGLKISVSNVYEFGRTFLARCLVFKGGDAIVDTDARGVTSTRTLSQAFQLPDYLIPALLTGTDLNIGIANKWRVIPSCNPSTHTKEMISERERVGKTTLCFDASALSIQSYTISLTQDSTVEKDVLGTSTTSQAVHIRTRLWTVEDESY